MKEQIVHLTTTGFYRPGRPKDLGAIDFSGEKSLTHQSFKDECDINNIMSRYAKTGVVTHVNRFQGRYGDFSEIADYQTALGIVKNAEEMFLTLPAQIRAEFDNDPGTFIEFAENPANLDRMVQLGLAEKVVVDLPSPPGDQAAGTAAAPSSGAVAPGSKPT